MPKATYMYWQKRFDRENPDREIEEKIQEIRTENKDYGLQSVKKWGVWWVKNRFFGGGCFRIGKFCVSLCPKMTIFPLKWWKKRMDCNSTKRKLITNSLK